jgi:ferritin-like metal-binding protein YciE
MLAERFRFFGPDSAGDRASFQHQKFGDRPMAAKAKTLHDAFYETLKDVYYAEKQSVRALKKSAKAAEHAELRSAFETHAEESAEQVERLQQVFEIIGKPARAKTCEAMQGITSEMEEDLEDFGDSPAADAVLAACAQAVEHYEIARYGTLKTWARQLGYEDAAKLLEQTLEEEKKTDALLSQIAEQINTEGAADQEDEGLTSAPAPAPQAARAADSLASSTAARSSISAINPSRRGSPLVPLRSDSRAAMACRSRVETRPMIREAFSRSSPSSRSLPRWADRRRRSSGVSVLLCSVRIASRPASDVAAVVPGPPVLVAGPATEKAGALSLRRGAALRPVLAVTKRVSTRMR